MYSVGVRATSGTGAEAGKSFDVDAPNAVTLALQDPLLQTDRFATTSLWASLMRAMQAACDFQIHDPIVANPDLFNVMKDLGIW